VETGTLPLDGIRVIELGNHVAGPYAAALLGDFGADVVKVEPSTTHAGSSHRLSDLEPEDPDRTLFHMTIARNKRSLALDVRSERGRELLLRLVEVSDVLVENFRPGTLERWGLGFEVLAARNPRLVVLRISGYGQDGPRGGEAGVDRIAQAFAGATHMTGFPEHPPVRSGLAIADYSAGLMGAFGVMMALRGRDRAEPGVPTAQVIDVSLFDALLPMLGEAPELHRRHGEVRGRTGNRHPGTAPGNSYQGADGGWLLISVPGDAIFARLARLIERPQWVDDPANRDAVSRDDAAAGLEAELGAWVAQRPAAEAVRLLAAAGVPASLVNTVADLVKEPQIVHRGSLVAVPDERLGEVLMAAPAPMLTRTPGAIRRAAPWPGQHSAEVLGQLGLDAAAIEQLRAEGVVG
jgi:formyl-CoA transferase